MQFHQTPLAGAYVIERDPYRDERGFFARTFCSEDFAKLGLTSLVVQCSVSFNRLRGTLRGLHLQAPPAEEARLVRCTRGRIFDAIADLRPESGTYLKWFGSELSAENGRQLYVPEGFAHGFQTLEDGSEVSYQISVPYNAELSRGYHYASPALGIEWPLPVSVISERDAALEPIDDARVRP